MSNKKKIFNDPIYGFITIASDLIFDIISHKYFQRLRRIKQLGLADFTYPAAHHTRFYHALGAMHLMGLAIENLKNKGHQINDDETEAVQIAILLHDIGHCPFSHALEFIIIAQVSHEQLTSIIIEKLNKEFQGKLDLAIAIFENKYHRKFFYQLVSSQLDIDRLDYLQRDCFFTGVSEGTIGADRIIKLLNIVDDEIVVEEKGIYSIENFLNARRLMYWQVYLHKTVVSAEQMIINLLRRAKYLVCKGQVLPATPSLSKFLNNAVQYDDLITDSATFEAFVNLDDYDIWAAIKYWCTHDDKVLQFLSNSLIERKLLKGIIATEEFCDEKYKEIILKFKHESTWDADELSYVVTKGSISNDAYHAGSHPINILKRNGEIKEIAEASDLPNIKALNQIVTKYFVCYPIVI